MVTHSLVSCSPASTVECCWHTAGSRLAHCWLTVGSLLAHCRSKHEIAWIDKKVKLLTDHKAKQSARLAVVTEQLEKFKAFPPEGDESPETLVRPSHHKS